MWDLHLFVQNIFLLDFQVFEIHIPPINEIMESYLKLLESSGYQRSVQSLIPSWGMQV